MPDNGARLDLILSIRLDLLEQALDEVEKVIVAMGDQRQRLDDVEQCLGPKGHIVNREKAVKTAVGDAINRLEIVLDGDSLELESDDANRLQDALERLSAVKDAIDLLATDRVAAHKSFQDVSRWSVAGLADMELAEAADEYRKLLDEIRDDPQPWQRYETELRGRGQKLFTRYLELLGGMAVRGFGIEGDMVGDAQALYRLLLQPLGRAAQGARPQRSLYLPMRTRHIPLGYLHWSLWALPLVGRSAGEHVLDKSTFHTPIDDRRKLFCADAYALYVLGPSYAHAALFLELDPDDASHDDAPDQLLPDSLRAQALLEQLPKLDENAEDELTEIAGRLAEPWGQARRALGVGDVTVDEADRKVVDRFLDEVRQSYPEIAYDTRWLNEAQQLGAKLAGSESLDAVAANHPRDLVTAVWLARVEHPARARHLHERAEELARRKPGVKPPEGAGRTRLRKGA